MRVSSVLISNVEKNIEREGVQTCDWCSALSNHCPHTAHTTSNRQIFFSTSTTPAQRNPGASTHSVSSVTPPDRIRFPRGTASRSTFHGGQLRDRRPATYNGPPASPTLSHDAQSRSRGSTNLFTKLTSKLTRR